MPLDLLHVVPHHRRQRLNWCRERWNSEAEWHNVILSDESRFYLGMQNDRRRVRRRRDKSRKVRFAVERHVGIRVWEAIPLGGRSSLFFVRGSIPAGIYVEATANL